MKKACLIGHPVTHSKSPLIHNYWLRNYGIEGDYQALDVSSENLRDEVMRLRDEGFAGFNVTLPHKQAVRDLCTTLDQEAEKIGAVNTVVFSPSGEIEGRNTDAFGFLQNAILTQPQFFALHGQDLGAAVIGAGGAARAVLFALRRLGLTDIRLTNRTLASAEALGAEFSARVYAWEDRVRATAGARLLINTTSLGMKSFPPLDLDLRYLTDDALVYDIVYAPLRTPLLQQAEARGLLTVTGIGMLLHQARPAFQAWFGVMPAVTPELQDMVLA